MLLAQNAKICPPPGASALGAVLPKPQSVASVLRSAPQQTGLADDEVVAAVNRHLRVRDGRRVVMQLPSGRTLRCITATTQTSLVFRLQLDNMIPLEFSWPRGVKRASNATKGKTDAAEATPASDTTPGPAPSASE